MSSREKIGLAVLVTLLLTAIGLLAVLVRPHGPSHSIEQNVFVKQRMEHLENMEKREK